MVPVGGTGVQGVRWAGCVGADACFRLDENLRSIDGDDSATLRHGADIGVDRARPSG